jgi:hypothetical protein
MKRTLYVLTLAFALLSGTAFAECTHSGRTYENGAKVGPYTCVDGQWVRR